MLKLSGPIFLSVLTLSIAEPPVNSYLPPSNIPNPGTCSGYPSNPNVNKPARLTATHGNQALIAGYSNSQASFNPQQYSSFSQRPSQYRLNSHGSRPANNYPTQNDAISSSYRPLNNQVKNNNGHYSGNGYNHQTSSSYLPPQAQKPNPSQFNQYLPPEVPSNLQSPMNAYIPPNNNGIGHTDHENVPSFVQKEPISNTYEKPNFMTNQDAIHFDNPSSYDPPPRPPSNQYLPANLPPQAPEFPISFPQDMSLPTDQDNNSPPSSSFVPPIDENQPSTPSSNDQASPSQKPNPALTEPPPLLALRNFPTPFNSYPTSFQNEPYSENSQYTSQQKPSPIVVPNTYQMFGQKNNANFESPNRYMDNSGYQPDHRQNRLRQGLAQAPYNRRLSDEPNQARAKSSQGIQHSTSAAPIKNAPQGSYSYEPPTSSSGPGQIKDETGYHY